MIVLHLCVCPVITCYANVITYRHLPSMETMVTKFLTMVTVIHMETAINTMETAIHSVINSLDQVICATVISSGCQSRVIISGLGQDNIGTSDMLGDI